MKNNVNSDSNCAFIFKNHKSAISPGLPSESRASVKDCMKKDEDKEELVNGTQ